MIIDLSHIKAELDVAKDVHGWRVRLAVPELDQAHRPGDVITTHMEVSRHPVNWMSLSPGKAALLLPSHEYTGVREDWWPFIRKARALAYRDKLVLAIYDWNDAPMLEPPTGIKGYRVVDYTRLRMAHFAVDLCAAHPDNGSGESTSVRLFGRLLRLDKHAPGLVKTETERLAHVNDAQVSMHTSVSGEVCLHWPNHAAYLRHRDTLTAWHDWTPDDYKRDADRKLASLTDRLVELLQKWDMQTE